jgi:uncharacterized protein YndB with AHSA1/START domain
MKFTLELPIYKPRAEVWEAFEDPENLKKWQPSLVTVETLQGTQGQPGAVSKLTFREHEREFSLMETVIRREEPERLDQLYENNFADNIVRNTFTEQGAEQTLWVVKTEYKFKTLVMRLLGPLMKKNLVARTQQDMARFKKAMEGSTSQV